MASSIQLLRSTIAQERPFPGNLLEGQPAVNLNASEPGLFFKTADGSLVKFGPAAITSDGSPPNSSPQGSAGNTVGELWLDKSFNPPVLKIYDGSEWVDAGSGSGGGGGGGSANYVRWIYTASGGETSLSGTSNGVLLQYVPNLEEVFVNGVLITRGVDYSAINGASITNLSPLSPGDVVTVTSMIPFETVQLPAEVSLLRWTIQATAGQTVLSGVDSTSQQLFYTAGFEEVYVNGAFLRRDIDYTASDGSTITLSSPLTVDDEVTVLGWAPFEVGAVSSATVSFSQSQPGAVGRTVEERLRDTVNVRDFGAVGDGITDDTAAIRAAMFTGKSVFFPLGNYLVSVLNVPYGLRGVTYYGEADYRYGTGGSRLVAKDVGQSHIFTCTGASNVTFRSLRIDCNNKADRGIDASLIPFLIVDSCGIYNFREYGILCRQGIAHINNCGCGTDRVTNPNAIGLSLYSDSYVTNSDFYGGKIPLQIVAGGNRLSNVLANTGNDCCVELAPLDNSTTHINTSLVNLYVGEVLSNSLVSKPIIRMKGTSVQKVQEVQLSNSYLVTAAGNPNKINGGIYLEHCDAISISNIVIRGNGLSGTTDQYCDYFIKAKLSKSITITGCTVRDVNKNPIYLESSIDNPVVISGCSFNNWSLSPAPTPEESAAIRCEAGTGAIITGCNFSLQSADTNPYAIYANSAGAVTVSGNRNSYPNPNFIVTGSGTPSFIGNDNGAVKVQNYRLIGCEIDNTSINRAANYDLSGNVQAAGGSSTALVTLSNATENRVYLISVRQSGSSANSVLAYLTSYGPNVGVVRIAQDNTNPLLDMSLSSTGLSVRLDLAAGFGLTNWVWTLTRIR